MTDELSIETYFEASERYDQTDVSEIPDEVRADINATLQTIASSED